MSDLLSRPRQRAGRRRAGGALHRAALRRAALAGAALAGSAALLGGCATRPPAADKAALTVYRQNDDPLEPTNRFFYRVNNTLDENLFRPAAKGYTTVVPAWGRARVNDFLVNLGTPVVLFNDMLQGKPRRAGFSLMRLLVNTTVGVGGLFDVATGWGWPAHQTDFGITLGVWGAGPGPYLYLPLLGPSDLRDGSARLADLGLGLAESPAVWGAPHDAAAVFGYSTALLGALNTRANLLGTISQIKRNSLDPYATFRSLYQQNRASQIARTIADHKATTPAWFLAPASPHSP